MHAREGGMSASGERKRDPWSNWDADHGAQDELEAVLDRIALAEEGFNELEWVAIGAIEAGYSRRRVAALTGISPRRLNHLIACSWFAVIGNPWTNSG